MSSKVVDIDDTSVGSFKFTANKFSSGGQFSRRPGTRNYIVRDSLERHAEVQMFLETECYGHEAPARGSHAPLVLSN